MSSLAQRFIGVALSAWVLGIGICATASAAPADLDRGFGGDGIVQVEGAAGATFSAVSSARMAVGPEGEIFVLYSDPQPCGGTLAGCTVGLSLVRYGQDGTRDASFGTGAGSQLVVHQPAEAHSFALAVGADGKPVVAASDGESVVLARFDDGGHLDATFGTGGTVTGFAEATLRDPAVAVQPDGKILAAVEGGEGSSESSILRVARFLGNGERDPGFGQAGETAIAMPTRSRPAGIAIDPVGDISLAAPQCCGGQPLFGNGISLVRLLATGQPDPVFNGGRPLVYPTPEAQSTVEAAAMAPHGAMVLAFEEDKGNSATVGNLVKVLPSGAFDQGFGHDGRVFAPARVGATTPSGLAVDSRGRIVGLGWDGSISFFRLNANGTVDRTFNGGQHVLVSFGGNQEAPLAVALESTGRIVALAETSCCGPKTFALLALRGDTDRTRCLGRRATIVGTRGPDKLVGTRRRDVIAGLGGKDTIRGLGGADLICGGKGRDKILGGPGHDRIRQ